MDPHEIQRQLATWLHEATHAFQKVPGSAVLIRYVKSSYQNDPIRSAIELILVIFFIRYILSPSYSTQKQNFIKLSEEVRRPFSLFPPVSLLPLTSAASHRRSTSSWTSGHPSRWSRRRQPWRRPRMRDFLSSSGRCGSPRHAKCSPELTWPVTAVTRPTGPKTKLSNGRTVTNLASYNFYNFNANEQIKEKAIQTLRTYGVGPCGPPQFYGTQDVHMRTEADIAAYLGTEGCIVYAQAFSTISSVIPAFCKRGDVIVADKAVNFSIRKGLEASRSNIKWFNHGDMQDLETQMRKVAQEQTKQKRLTRRFIVTEGLFETTGDCTDLPTLVCHIFPVSPTTYSTCLDLILPPPPR